MKSGLHSSKAQGFLLLSHQCGSMNCVKMFVASDSSSEKELSPIARIQEVARFQG